MAQTIDISEVNIAANAFTEALPSVNDSPFNPVERTSRISLYVVTDAAATPAVTYGLQIGGVSHGANIEAVSKATLSLSTRDDKILEGVALRGQKISVSRRETGAVATTDTRGLVIIEAI